MKKAKYTVLLPKALSNTPQYFWVTDKLEIMAFKDENKVRAIQSICPHMGAQLCYDHGKKEVHCPWHPLRFDVNTLKSGHHEFKKIREMQAEVHDGHLVIYE